MTDKELAEKVFHSMYDNDPFSKWLGIELVNIDKGTCELTMEVRPEMLNGFDIMHGGISYSLADSAFAFASNSYGQMAVTTNVNMQYPGAVNKGDILRAKAETVSITKKIATLDVEITNQNNKKVGLFRGTAYITSKSWFNQ